MAKYDFEKTPDLCKAYGTGNYFTIGELKNLIQYLPDDMPLFVTHRATEEVNLVFDEAPTLEVRDIEYKHGRFKGDTFKRAFLRFSQCFGIKQLVNENHKMRVREAKLLSTFADLYPNYVVEDNDEDTEE